MLPDVLHGLHHPPGPLHILLKQQALQELHQNQKKGKFTCTFLGVWISNKIYFFKKILYILLNVINIIDLTIEYGAIPKKKWNLKSSIQLNPEY